jgi:hypothetical protein
VWSFWLINRLVAHDDRRCFYQAADQTNQAMWPRYAVMDFFVSALLYREGEALLLHGETCPMTSLPARATSAASRASRL